MGSFPVAARVRMRALWLGGPVAGIAIAVAASAACKEGPSELPPLLAQGGSNVDAGADVWTPGPDAGTVVVLASGVATPTSIALDASNVYWTDNAGAVWSVPRGGGPTTLITTGQASPLGIVVNGNGYWLAGNSATSEGSVVAFDFTSGLATSIASGLAGSYGLVASPSYVFWTARNASSTGVSLQELALGSDAGVPVELATVTGGGSAGGLAVDADFAYFAVSMTGGGGAVAKVPLTGGPPATVWTTPTGEPTDLVLGAGAIYWLVPAATPLGEVWSAPSGGTPAVLAAGLNGPGHLAVDGTNAYWTSPGEGEIDSIPLVPGGNAAVLAGALATPMALVVDDALYFTTVDGISKLSI